ncbi:MAG: hypothetical protein AABW93_03780 [Nanoarchaeota archaeon]
MSLRLNQSSENFKEFYGRNVEQMPKLIADGRIPLSVAGLMQRRLDVRNASDDVKSSWMDNYFDTGDAVVYHPDGRVKIVLDSQTLREINPDSKRNLGALVLTPEQYDTMSGEEFKKDKIGKIGDSLSKKDVKDHPVWRVLARDEALLNYYADYVFAEGEQRFYYDTAMGVYLTSAAVSTPEMRAWCVVRLEGRSCVSGRVVLDDGDGRLVGVAPEA